MRPIREYHVSPLDAEGLRQEHGWTDETFAGLSVVVSAAVPPGQAYLIDTTKPWPQRPISRFKTLEGTVLRKSDCWAIKIDGMA